MKILNTICSADPAQGGPIESINQIGTALIANGDEVEIASMDSPHADHLAESPLPVHALGPSSGVYGYSSRFVPWLQANAGKYDCVIVNGIWQFHSLGTWQAARISKVPYFVFTHGMLDPWFKKQFPLKHFKKWMYWPWADYRVLRDAQAVLFTCEEERRLARSSFWLYRCNETVVSFGTSESKEDAREAKKQFLQSYPELRLKKIVLFIGRIHPKKGCDLLIQAFAKVLQQHPEWHLVIAGPDNGGTQATLRALAARLNLEKHITWTGMIRGAMKWGALHSAEVFALSSHQENFGIAVAEALSVGLPALISNKVNIWREIEADGAGIVADDTLAGTCHLLQSYVDLSNEKTACMKVRARESFQKRFEIQGVATHLHSLLTQYA